jgi:hypothetical protein
MWLQTQNSLLLVALWKASRLSLNQLTWRLEYPVSHLQCKQCLWTLKIASVQKILSTTTGSLKNEKHPTLCEVMQWSMEHDIQNCEKWLLASSCLSLSLSTWNNSAFTGRILIKVYIWAFFENLSRNFKFLLKSDKNNGHFTWRRFDINDNISLNFS